MRSVEELVSGDDRRRAIEFAARFRTRSFNNMLLIRAQHLEAHEQGRVPTPTWGWAERRAGDHRPGGRDRGADLARRRCAAG